MGIYYAIRRACTNKSVRTQTRRGLSMSSISFFTISTIWFGLIFFEDKISRTAAYILRRDPIPRNSCFECFLWCCRRKLEVCLLGVYLRVKKASMFLGRSLMTRSNSFIKRRLSFESMIVALYSQAAAAFCAAAFYNFLAGRGFCPLPKAV